MRSRLDYAFLEIYSSALFQLFFVAKLGSLPFTTITSRLFNLLYDPIRHQGALAENVPLTQVCRPFNPLVRESLSRLQDLLDPPTQLPPVSPVLKLRSNPFGIPRHSARLHPSYNALHHAEPAPRSPIGCPTQHAATQRECCRWVGFFFKTVAD